MDKEGSGRRRTGINIQRLFIVIGCLFAILILGLISATLHYVIQLRNNAKDSSSSPSDNPMTSEQFLRSLPLPVRFPGYFRSPDEQKLAEERLLSRTFVPAPNGTVDGLVNTCSGVCYKPTDWRPVVINTLYHACCISNSYYESPTWVIDINGNNKTLATFGGMKQYFVKEDCMDNCVFVSGNSFHVAGAWYAKEPCPYDFVFTVGIMGIRLSEEERTYLAGVYTWGRPDRYAELESVSETWHREHILQVDGCTTCQCQTMTTYENAVVYTNNKTDYEIAWFSVAGCCKCINR